MLARNNRDLQSFPIRKGKHLKSIRSIHFGKLGKCFSDGFTRERGRKIIIDKNSVVVGSPTWGIQRIDRY
jgi:hypothetical protein